MTVENEAPVYRVWGADDLAYGPVDLPTLITWVQGGWVVPDSWIYVQEEKSWRKAADLEELRVILRRKTAPAPATPEASAEPGVSVAALRRVRVLGGMEDRHLESLLRYLEVIRVPAFASVVRHGEHGDSLYFVLEGELRARVVVEGKETTLRTLGTGDTFGEVSLLDHGPRSADVLANRESTLARMSSTTLERLLREAPALTAPFLYALSKSVVGTVRSLTKKYQDSVHWARSASRPE